MDEVTKKRFEFAKSLTQVKRRNDIHYSVEVGPGSYIGGDGFGWIRLDDGTLFKMPHTGNVVIERDVVIGSNVCIDRAVIGSTFIGKGTKIDNLVHIAHGVKIGRNCLIVAHAGIGGSVEIGDNCWIGFGCLIKQKVKIGNNVTIGMGAVVLKDIPDGETWVGNPARKLSKGSPPPEMTSHDDLAMPPISKDFHELEKQFRNGS